MHHWHVEKLVTLQRRHCLSWFQDACGSWVSWQFFFRIHKLKPDFAIFGRPYCIFQLLFNTYRNACAAISRSVGLDFVGDKLCRRLSESCFLKVWAICFSLQCQSRKWQVWNLRELNYRVDSWKTRSKMAITRVAYGPCFWIRPNSCMFVCVPPRDVQMGLCALLVRTP